MENKGYSQVADLPSHQFLRHNGAVLGQSYGMVHPSGPAYRLLTAGQIFTPQYLWVKPEPNVASAYATLGIPSYNWYPKGKPALKHDPYKQIQPGITTWQKPFDPEQLPVNCQVFLGLDTVSNGHDPGAQPSVGAKQIDHTLNDILAKLKTSKWFNTADASGHYPVFVVTYDESFAGDQHIFTALYGRGVKAGTFTTQHYDHLSLCRTLTDNWHLPPLGDCAKAKPISDVWVTTPKTGARPVARLTAH